MKILTNILTVYRQAGRTHKVLFWLLATLAVVASGMYGTARWYAVSQQHKPLVLGSSFIPAYAERFGLDPEETFDAMLGDLGIRHFRLVSYWSQLEPEQGKYDFSLLDWQFKKAEDAGAKITLSLGLRQPRWPECHIPAWAKDMPASQWQPLLEQYMTEVVNRYKNSPALDSYQVENEFFLKGFGLCTNHDRQRLVSEYNLVKRLDPKHKIIISRSNNAIGWPVGKPTPDEFGVSVYKRVWSPVIGRYLEYPFPAWFYGFLAGWQKIMTGRDMIIHELQAEAWAPNYKDLKDISLDEQNKSLDAERFKERVEYGKATGMREIYLWSGEYWYYRKQKLNDPTMWKAAKEAFKAAESEAPAKP